ncbi:MAG TPA: Spy/CpxP family protein refolding chaperone [Candidatus Sulfotelmatobacter sp.]|jgi:hypothetical protein|nr:Spy/CpxP family protein refolding chaperone [Candidatus Sulfotelmatobacter sp.]
MKHRSVIAAAALIAMPLMWASAASAETAPPAPDHQMAKQPSEKDLAAWHKTMCSERYAHESGHLAYLQARLELTDKQIPAWVKWAQIQTQSAEKERDACLSMAPKGDAKPSIVEREADMEKHLSLRLQSIQASRPALQNLYDVLTPEQRAVLDQPHEGRPGPMGGPMGAPGGHEGPEGHHPLG